jgi:hypothetical protein
MVQAGRRQSSAKTVIIAISFILLAISACSSSVLAVPGVPVVSSQAPKATRTVAERKIDSKLLERIALERGGAPIGRQGSLDVDVEGRVLVDIACDVSDDLLRTIRETNGLVVNSFPQSKSIRARVAVGALIALAEKPAVKSITVAATPLTNPPV